MSSSPSRQIRLTNFRFASESPSIYRCVIDKLAWPASCCTSRKLPRARAVLGWEPSHSLRETLPKMVAALKADPRGWYEENKLTPPADVDQAKELAGSGRASK
jgi:hypothetical protein